jgi:uncharacterized membrane protein (UPF0127 family)
MSLRINNKNYPTEHLKTPEELSTGMMGRTELNGCLVFHLEKGHHRFHMKNCLIPLDIVFISNKIITKIHENCQPCDGECDETFTGLGDMVIEFPSGTSKDFKVGDKISLF